MKKWIALSTSVLAVACAPSQQTQSSSGSARLVWQNTAVNFDTTGGVGTTLNSSGITSQAVTVPLSMSQVASLLPPTANSASLQANAVTFSGTKAYVAYNTQGAATAGGIDVIDFSNPSAPVMSSQVVYPTVDINNLYQIGTELYAVGADNSDNPAVLYDFALSSGNISAAPTIVQLPGHTGVGVKADLLNVYALSGDNGGLSILSRSGLASSAYTAIEDARDLSVDLTGVNVVTGKTSSHEAHVVRHSLLGVLNQTSANMTGATQGDGGKATIVSGTFLSVATAGTGGTNLVCGVGGAISANIPIPSSTTLSVDNRAANSAAYGNGLLYVANGAAGINVYTLELGNLTPSCSVTSSYVGRISFEDGVSVNNVAYSSGKLIVATGLGGFRIISVTQGLSVGLQLSL